MNCFYLFLHFGLGSSLSSPEKLFKLLRAHFDFSFKLKPIQKLIISCQFSIISFQFKEFILSSAFCFKIQKISYLFFIRYQCPILWISIQFPKYKKTKPKTINSHIFATENHEGKTSKRFDLEYQCLVFIFCDKRFICDKLQN